MRRYLPPGWRARATRWLWRLEKEHGLKVQKFTLPRYEVVLTSIDLRNLVQQAIQELYGDAVDLAGEEVYVYVDTGARGEFGNTNDADQATYLIEGGCEGEVVCFVVAIDEEEAAQKAQLSPLETLSVIES